MPSRNLEVSGFFVYISPRNGDALTQFNPYYHDTIRYPGERYCVADRSSYE